MHQEVYMTTGEKSEPRTQEEMLDACPLNGGIALIKAFIEAKAKECGFKDIQVFQPSYASHPRVDIRVIFNSEAEKGCRNSREKTKEQNLRLFEQKVLAVTERLDKNLEHRGASNRESYTFSLSQDYVPSFALRIKNEIAHQLPTSAYIAQLKR
jgi:hypothetical protein